MLEIIENDLDENSLFITCKGEIHFDYYSFNEHEHAQRHKN